MRFRICARPLRHVPSHLALAPVSSNPAARPVAAPPSFTSQEFRAALGQFATGVTIVTTRDAQGHAVGLTANSFNSVSLEPPLVLWSLSKRSSSLPAFTAGTHFCINVLTAEQRMLAERFASKAVDRFEGVHWRPGSGNAPVIEGVAAAFECFHHSHHDAGDHVIFIGQVERCDRRLGAPPLLFVGGRLVSDLTV
jgi:flavin reductase (DIM6/NTAB) family NADH-FMN oxidoreductase RutF